MRLDGAVAVVTGAAGGLGSASARRLAEAGASIVLVDRNGKELPALARGLPSDAISVEADISTDEGVEEYMSAGVRAFGAIDYYHLNAGIMGRDRPLHALPTTDFREVLDVNVVGTFIGIREAFRRFAVQGTTGAIVVTGSVLGLGAGHDVIAYTASKHGVHGLVLSAAMYGGPLGVRVNAVAPGIVPTGLGGPDMEARGKTQPMRRAGTPEEIAAVVNFLLSDVSSYVNGAILSADGGSAAVSAVRPAGGAGAWDTTKIDDSLRRAAQDAE